MANGLFPANQPLQGPPQPPQLQQQKPPLHEYLGRLATSLAETVKAGVTALFWLAIAAGAFGAFYVGMRAIWTVVQRALAALGQA